MKFDQTSTLYNDGLITAIVLNNNVKLAEEKGLVYSLVEKVKSYVSNHVNPDDKAGSLFNILGPGVIAITFRAMNLGWIGTLIALAMRVFNINVTEIVGSIWNQLKPEIVGDKKISSSQIDNIVDNAMKMHVQPATQEEAEKLNKMTAKSNLHDAKLLKLAMMNYKTSFTKEAGFFEMFSARKTKSASILSRILSWVFKVAFASAGLLVAGDIVNKFLGRPSGLDDTIQHGKPVEKEPEPVVVSKQTKFPTKPGFPTEKYNINSSWIENITNDESSIENLLITFAKEVYAGLDGKEQIIRSSPAFQVVKNRIVWYNHNSSGAPFIMLPKYFTSKKQIVDFFIDDVAEHVR